MKTHPVVARLAKERRARATSQARTAAHLHVTPVTLSNWETGRHQPHLEMLDAWAALSGLRLTPTPIDQETP